LHEARAAGAWVKSQRLASGMTQEELAVKSGLSVRAISNLERGRTARPHPRSLEALAVALGLPETAGTAWATRLRADQAGDASSPAPPPQPAPLAAENGSKAPQLARAARLRPTRRMQIGLASLFVLLTLVILAVLALVAPTAKSHDGAGLRTPGPSSPVGSSVGHAPSQWAPPAVLLGIWTSAEGGDGDYSTVAGQHPNVANTYLFWGDSFPASFASQAQSAGAIPFVEIEPWQGGGPNDCSYAPHFPAMTTIGANGVAISRYLNAFGSAIASFGHPVIITFAREFNVSGQYPWAQGDCEGTTPAQWVKAWDTVRSDIDATAGGLAHFMWAPGADTGGTTIDPTPYWPGASEVDMVGVEGFPNTRFGPQLGTFSGMFGPVFHEIHTLTSLPIFIAETDLAPLGGSGYQSLAGFISDLCSNGGDGVLQFQDTQTLSGKQWTELDKALASDCGASTAEGAH
jgi:transcriptional regulator with XRE-family HTH domain